MLLPSLLELTCEETIYGPGLLLFENAATLSWERSLSKFVYVIPSQVLTLLF